MTYNETTVRAGKRRLAPRGKFALMFGIGLLLLASAGRAVNVSERFSRTQSVVVQDTLQMRALLERVRGVDVTICSLLGRALNNRWGSWYGSLIIDAQDTDLDNSLLAWLDNAEIEARHIPVLRASLSDADPCVRRTAAQLLGRARISNLSSELRTELQSPNAATRQAALIALGTFDKPSGFEAARDGLRDADVNVRVAAAWALGAMEQVQAVSPLTEVARAPDARLRRTVAWALGAIESPDALPALTGLLADPEPSVRIQAAHALGSIEHRDAVPALMRLLESDRDPQVRRAAAAALGRING